MTGGPASDDQEFIIKKIAKKKKKRKLLYARGARIRFVPSPLQRVTTDASGAVELTLLDSHLKRKLSFGPTQS